MATHVCSCLSVRICMYACAVVVCQADRPVNVQIYVCTMAYVISVYTFAYIQLHDMHICMHVMYIYYIYHASISVYLCVLRCGWRVVSLQWQH